MHLSTEPTTRNGIDGFAVIRHWEDGDELVTFYVSRAAAEAYVRARARPKNARPDLSRAKRRSFTADQRSKLNLESRNRTR